MQFGDFNISKDKDGKIIVFDKSMNMPLCEFIPIFEGDEYSIDVVCVHSFKRSKKLRKAIFALHEACETLSQLYEGFGPR